MRPRPWVVVVSGLAATGGVVIAAAVMMASVALQRCGGFFGTNDAVPGTLSARLCHRDLGEVLFVVMLVVPLAAGVAGSVLAGRSGRHRTWQLPLAGGAAVAAGAIVLVAISGDVG